MVQVIEQGSVCQLDHSRVTMGIDTLSSPHRRTQNSTAFSSASKKQIHAREDGEGWGTLLRRHHFLLTMLVLLAFLCTIYLYFAVTLAPPEPCAGMNGAEKAACRLEQGKASMRKGKLRFF